MIYFARIDFGTFEIHPVWVERPRIICFIKIGCSINPITRVKRLAWEHNQPMTILATMKGNVEKEAKLHRRFSHIQLESVYGKRKPEWFYPTSELMDFIRSIPGASVEQIGTIDYSREKSHVLP